jgi:hypothetical protein
MPTCKLCREEAPSLVKAHVIPRSFYEIDPDLPAPRLITNTKGVYPKKSPIGVYDETIVCAKCEERFSRCDDYAARLLLHQAGEFEKLPNPETGQLGGYRIREYDYHLLKMFVIATLWRASAAEQPTFARVDLGPFEARAREMLLNDTPGDPQEFGALLLAWDVDYSVIMDPLREKPFGPNTYRFYLGRYHAVIKVDKRPFPQKWEPGLLRPGQPLEVVLRHYEGSKDFEVAARLSQANAGYLAKAFGRKK